ncbi:hypothetical protein UK23_23815 [Lentzea aerocolonigenes]|uniref:Uncharacterized protein n=1 Tax=Lentzea aerocolonigenes TaxID=68170 RepID=A0A0F0GUT7_LENAE|nr:hypothetical protein [Lentzea aerocolonigenes]KJK46346.1 hypothetical protein UK23_23815 [Lentzea aerocolonigenes]
MSRRVQFAHTARLCRVCGYSLNDVSGRGVHPLCADPEEIWWTRHDLDQAVRTIARRAIAQSPGRNDVVAAVCSLMVIDPSNRQHVEAVVSAILRDAGSDPLWRTTANGWRPYLPSWVRPGVVGATVQRLVAVKLLRPTGQYVRCSDTEARNGGKPQPVYAVDVTALEHAEDAATERAAAGLSGRRGEDDGPQEVVPRAAS